MDGLEAFLSVYVLELEIPHFFFIHHEEDSNRSLRKARGDSLDFWKIIAHEAIFPLVNFHGVQDSQLPDHRFFAVKVEGDRCFRREGGDFIICHRGVLIFLSLLRG